MNKSIFQQHLNNHEWEAALRFVNDSQNNHLFSESQFKDTNLLLLQLVGKKYQEQGRPDIAIKYFETALKIEPGYIPTYLEINHLLKLSCEFEQCIEVLKAAQKIDEHNARIFSDLGIAYQNLGEYDKAENHYLEAIKQDPNLCYPQFNLGLLKLLQGDYATGFELYENRFKTEKYAKADRHFIEKLWQDQDLTGKTLFVVSEQGFGDSLLFSRFLKSLKQKSKKLILCCREALHPLFEQNDFADEYRHVSEGFDLEYDYHIPMMSLGHRLHLDKKHLANAPYIKADPKQVQEWQKKIKHIDKLNIGLVTSGGNEFTMNQIRNCPKSYFQPLLSMDEYDFYCLEPDYQGGEFDAYQNFYQYAHELSDFSDTAAFIENLDLIITVDTAVAHLAGAMGKTVWLLLYIPPAWQWGTDETQSAWYPNITLFRQKTPGAWQAVIDSIEERLKHYGSKA